ncbi:LANO_0D06282g1_1 [Lachancea nothofagi CBS 11611]|uniref:U3 small nucleolar RNA-associated protein 11 n=1 Tax=Lachancea nothofagi CBS 11611 TaxID=1266666 RepID=A0A1G4JHB2_9SACH|nr:LANO_0D06282g1_1 [Lachancea nothofagi CBS 11611]
MAKLVHNVQKKQHRERSQVSSRSRFGFLEKHKDYVKRAQNYHQKQATLKILREKAQQRNPDEFYHGMHSRTLDSKGLLQKSRQSKGEDPSLSTEQVKLLKTQDANYVRTLRQNERQVLEKQAQTTMFKSRGAHTVFVEDQESLQSFDAAKHFNTTPELLHRRENRLTRDQLANQGLQAGVKQIGTDTETLERKRLKKLRQLQQHQDREKQLSGVLQRMEMEREGMKKGSKKKVEDAHGNVAFKWKKQRKR